MTAKMGKQFSLQCSSLVAIITHKNKNVWISKELYCLSQHDCLQYMHDIDLVKIKLIPDLYTVEIFSQK